MDEVDVKAMEQRMDAIRLKAWLSPEALTEKELMCLQIEENGLGCTSQPNVLQFLVKG